MPKRSHAKPLRRSESRPRKTPPRLITKAHQLERDEDLQAADAARLLAERARKSKSR